MLHRVGSAFTVVCTLLAPFAANAQVAQPAVWQGPARPPNAQTSAPAPYPQTYAQPAYPQAHAQPAYPQPYAQPAYPQPYAQPAYPQPYAQPAYPPARVQPVYPPSRAQLNYLSTPTHVAYSQANAQRPYPQAYYSAGYAKPGNASASGPTPAAYGYTQHPGYGSAYAAPYYGSSYAQGSQGVAYASGQRGEAPPPPIKTKDNLHYVEMGIGAFVPTDSGNPAKVGLEASLWAIHGGWVPSSGLYLTLDASTGFDIGCMAARATDGCKGHLRIHWIGAGPFFNTGTPMIARDVPRSWDLMALTGAEVRLWKGMTTKATINWFVPSPWGVYEYEKQLTEARLSGAASVAPGAASGLAATPNPMDAMESILGHALKHPQLNLMAMWEF
jgi:hypothetical protein